MGPFPGGAPSNGQIASDALRVWIWVPEGEEIPVGAIVPHEAFLPHADLAHSSVIVRDERNRQQASG